MTFNAYTISDFEVLLSYHDVIWVRRVRQVISRQPYGGPEYGIHIYYQDAEGRDLAYYTPIMETGMIFEEPRTVGSHIEVVSY